MNLSIWNKLNNDDRKKLLEGASERVFEKKTIMLGGSNECLGMLVVKTGQLRVFILSENGREITLYRLLENDVCVFSASCLFRNISFKINIEAEKDTTAIVIAPNIVDSVVKCSTVFSNYINEIMAAKFSDVMWTLEQVLFFSFDKRLALFLLEQAYLENSNTLRITHEEIANHMGSAREVVSRMLKYFSLEGIVALQRGTITIENINKLQALTDIQGSNLPKI